MSDIKISEAFELPVFAKNHGVGERCSIFEGKGLTVASSFYSNQLDRYELICHAINNHDRLFEENTQLKADKAELVDMLDFLVDNGSITDISIEQEVNSIIQKHKEQNNA